MSLTNNYVGWNLFTFIFKYHDLHLKLPCRRVGTKENENLSTGDVPLCLMAGIVYFGRTIPDRREGYHGYYNQKGMRP
jgi:hypothetical protein